VPLIIATPNMKSAGKTTDALAELLDLYPTLIDLCGLPKRPEQDGVSLAPLLDTPSASVRETALTQHPRPAYYTGAPETMGYSIRSNQYRYTEWRDWNTGETVASELYDHQSDPHETRNLSNHEDQQAIIKQHAILLQQTKPIITLGWTPVLQK
jgi:iduronate 2-sulfatase